MKSDSIDFASFICGPVRVQYFFEMLYTLSISHVSTICIVHFLIFEIYFEHENNLDESK